MTLTGIRFTAAFLYGSLLSYVSAQSRDLTTVPGANGASVVKAVLSKLDASGIFQQSGNADLTNVFLRNMAFAETRDGTDFPSGGGTTEGGIWNITTAQLKQTKQHSSQAHDDIKTYLGQDWRNVAISDLDKPLYSGMAARLYLTYVIDAGIDIPPIENQGKFWNNNFKAGNGDIQKWIEAIISLQEIEICSINTDIVFVLDSSGSINSDDPTNYDKIKNYTRAFVDALIDGNSRGEGDRIGIVIYGSEGNVSLPLSESEHMDKKAILKHIDSIPYFDESTNTADGLCRAIDQPWRDSLSVLRILVTLTDGMSNQVSSECGTTSEAAELVHSNKPPLLSYVIGVANANEDELLMISSAPELIDHLDTFNMELFAAAQEARSYQICFTVHQPQEIGDQVEGTAGKGEIIRISFSPLTEEGITIQFCIHEGEIAIYTSTSVANPSAAVSDWSMTITAPQDLQTITCFNFFFNKMDYPTEIPNNDPELPTPRRKRQAETNLNGSTTLYVSIEGQQNFNQFSLNSTRGGDILLDTGSGVGLFAILLPTIIGLLILSSFIVVAMFFLVAKCEKPQKIQPIGTDHVFN